MNLNMFEGYEIENKIELDFDDTYIHWFKTLSAFANTDGGIMNVGITDSLYEIGFPLNEIDHIRRSVNNYCFNHSKPILKCDFEVVKIENKENRYFVIKLKNIPF